MAGSLVLVDGSGYIFRAFHALPPMNRSDGTPVNAVFGFTAMLLKLIEDRPGDHIAVIFDSARATFRNQIYPGYKANRPEPPEELIPQFALVREATRALGVPALELEGFEADDLIAAYAKAGTAVGHDVVIVSSDKDLMQLVRDGVSMWDPIKQRPIGPAEVMEKFGVPPEKVVEVQALAGDAVDAVPGVPGIGIKTAAQLIAEYGDLETLLARAHEIRQPKRRETLIENAEKARISKRLVTLDADAPLPRPIEDLSAHPDRSAMLAFLKAQEFKRLIAKVESGGSTEAAVAPPPPPKPAEAGYVLVQDEAALADWIARAGEAGVVAFDCETTSLDAMQAVLVGVSLAVEPGSACYVPLGHVGDLASGRPLQMAKDRVLALLKPLLEDPAVLKVGHNIKYDALVFARHGIAIAPIDDSMLVSYVLEGSLHGHGMDELSELVLGHKTISFGEVAGTGKQQVTFDHVPLERARDYAAEDADVTLRLWRALKPRLAQESMATVYETLERPLVPVLVAMERAGVKVDRQALAALSQDFAQRMAALEAEIHGLAGRPFNLGSPKQLGEVLFDELKLPGGTRTKTGAYATGAEVLDELAIHHPLPQKLLDWRQLAKLKSTYADALVGQINPETGRVHTSFAMAATSTGRLSSTDPNLQNIPVRTEEGRRIREAFVAEPGNVLLSIDYSQIELRIVAEIGDIQALKDAFRDGIDIHALTASQVFGVPIEGMDPMVRRKAKAINFGIIYGISGFGLARQLGVDQSEASAYIKAYFAKYPGIRAYMDRAKAEAKANGMVRTLFGRKCHVPGIRDNNPARRAFAERQAINAPIQGTAADIIKRAMVRVPPALAAAGIDARMLLQVHDELLFEVPEGEAAAAATLIREVMEKAPLPAVRLGVPIIAEAGSGRSWAAAH
ncbi:MAG: DNA polymerase I [Thalassobaculales bacterium]